MSSSSSSTPTTERLHAAYAVAMSLSDAATLEEAAPAILRAIGECMGWDVGGLWVRDDGGAVLRCVAMWRAEGAPGAAFVEASRARTFARGVGLPGRVWEKREPAWVRDVVHDENFPRAAVAAADGLHGAFAVPICDGPEVIGALEFFHREVREPDAEALRFFATVGAQIGQFLERGRSEASRRAEEEKSRRILENALDAFVSMDPDGTITAWNRRAEDLFGWTAGEVVGRPLRDVIVPEAQRTFHEAGLRRFLATGVGPLLGRRVETTALHRDGASFPVELWITALRERDEWTFHAFLRDIRVRRDAEEALRRSEEASRRRAEAFRCLVTASTAPSADYFERLAAALGDALGARTVVFGEVQGGPARRLRSMAVWTGGRRGEPIDIGIEGTSWDVLTQGTCFQREGPPKRFPWDDRGTTHATGSWIGTPIRTATGRLLGLVAALHDTAPPEGFDAVTMVEVFAARIAAEIERRQNEATLRESRERFRLLVEGIPNHSLVTLDVTGRIASWNAGAERMHGFRAEQVLGRDLGVLCGEGLTAKKLELTAEHGSFYYEAWAHRADGTTFPAEITLSALRDERGRLYGYARVAREIASGTPGPGRAEAP